MDVEPQDLLGTSRIDVEPREIMSRLVAVKGRGEFRQEGSRIDLKVVVPHELYTTNTSYGEPL